MIRIATFNSNSVRARLSLILDWLDRIQPDVLCLQETKIQDKDFPVASFESAGYQAVFKGQKSYNGVAFISKMPLKDVVDHICTPGGEEARFIAARSGSLSLINVYVPQGFAPGSEKFAYKLRWLGDLLSYLKGYHDPTFPLLVAGDFNVALEPMDVYDPEGLRGQVGFHPEEQALMRDLLDWGLIDVFRKHCPDGQHYTFWDYRIPNAFKRKMGWRVDYILATLPLAEKSTAAWIDTQERVRQKPSDHTYLLAEFQIEL